MITLDEIIAYCSEKAETYRTASDRIPGKHPDKLVKGWEHMHEMYSTLARMAAHYKANRGDRG